MRKLTNIWHDLDRLVAAALVIMSMLVCLVSVSIARRMLLGPTAAEVQVTLQDSVNELQEATADLQEAVDQLRSSAADVEINEGLDSIDERLEEVDLQLELLELNIDEPISSDIVQEPEPALPEEEPLPSSSSSYVRSILEIVGLLSIAMAVILGIILNSRQTRRRHLKLENTLSERQPNP